MSPTFRRVFLFVLTFSLTALAAAQEPPPAPPAEGPDAVRVTVEEVRIPVAAYGEGGRFDPTLAAEDLLVREDGVAQQVRGVYRLPADVLLVLDTGGSENPAKRLELTRGAAAGLVKALRPEDRLFGRGGPPREELERREAEFEQLTGETGGTLSLPATAAQMIEQAAEVADEIDARYVVTYKPSRPIADARPGEYRRLDLIARRLGLTVRTRRGYFVKKSDE